LRYGLLQILPFAQVRSRGDRRDGRVKEVVTPGETSRLLDRPVEQRSPSASSFRSPA
jgi:hypothetical protein